MARSGPIKVEISPGELLDKIAILEIKAGRIADPQKLAHVRHELGMLERARDAFVPRPSVLSPLTGELRAVNEALWEIEDAIRAEEAAARFGPRFIVLARAVYRNNDRRAAIKKRINELLGSAIVEEMCYAGGVGEPASPPAEAPGAELVPASPPPRQV